MLFRDIIGGSKKSQLHYFDVYNGGHTYTFNHLKLRMNFSYLLTVSTQLGIYHRCIVKISYFDVYRVYNGRLLYTFICNGAETKYLN